MNLNYFAHIRTVSFSFLITALASCEFGGTPSVTSPILDTSPSISSITPSSGTEIGETGFTITGTNLTGTSAVTIGGLAATSVNVVNSTTVTGVSPASTLGAKDVVITTADGSDTLSAGYTYVANSAGLSSGGGEVACLGGGVSDLIVSATSVGSLEWGGTGVVTGAIGVNDGDTNTTTIVSSVGPGSYAARACADYEVDSQGNTPCEAGNTCYSDWFLPAIAQLTCFYNNRASAGTWSAVQYWSSSESGGVPATLAEAYDFNAGIGNAIGKNTVHAFACARAF